MNVIIYTVKGMDYYQLGTPAKHTLSEPTIFPRMDKPRGIFPSQWLRGIRIKRRNAGNL